MKLLLALIVLFYALDASVSRAALSIRLPETLGEQVLSSTVPLIPFAPNGFTADDFAVDWIGAPIPGATIRLGKKSFQWTRILDVMRIPRGRLILEVEGADGGQVTSTPGYVQPLLVEEGKASAEVPIALVGGERNATEILVKRGGREYRGHVGVKFHPRPETLERLNAGERVLLDSSCSPYRVNFDSIGAKPDEWVYVGCRLAHVKGDKMRTSSLELLVYWEGAGDKIDIEGIATEAHTPSLWPLRMRAEPGVVHLKSGSHALTLRYSILEKLYIFGIGAGIGPYSYDFHGPQGMFHKITALPTLYGSYYIDEHMRIAGFGAGAIDENYYLDIGLYLIMEEFRALDERLSVNLMLGAHVLGFPDSIQHRWAFSAPQGVEATYRDFGGKGLNITVGSFLYPTINDRHYYNLWLRYGTNRWFTELNYIGWEEPLGDGDRVFTRSVGVSVGVPFLLKLL